MRATNFALRPMIRDDEDPADAWEILEIAHDDVGSVLAKRVGIVQNPGMAYSPLSFLQFLLSCYNDQQTQVTEKVEENEVISGEFTEV